MFAPTDRCSNIFLSTPSARRATRGADPADRAGIFLSTPSARRATIPLSCGHTFRRISIHALREEGDFCMVERQRQERISIHALREEGDEQQAAMSYNSAISIHALREEGDRRSRRGRGLQSNFYPRPPRGGRRTRDKKSAFRSQFLSTPSARRATVFAGLNRGDLFNFYPRPPRGGRRGQRRQAQRGHEISIHALREEGDETRAAYNALPWKFLSTPSARRATVDDPDIFEKVQFLSTPSARRATC